MPELPISGANTQFQVGDSASPEVFTTLAEVRSISGPTTSVDLIDTSSLSSGVWKRKVPGMIDAGSISFELAFIPGSEGHVDMFNDLKARTRRNCKIVFPEGTDTEINFAGYFIKCELDFPMDNVIVGSVEVAIDGEFTIDEVED